MFTMKGVMRKMRNINLLSLTAMAKLIISFLTSNTKDCNFSENLTAYLVLWAKFRQL